MKLGIIFKKEFQEGYGKKQEFFGDKITIKHDLEGTNRIIIKTEEYPTKYRKHSIERIEHIHIGVIQLIYLGDWK